MKAETINFTVEEALLRHLQMGPARLFTKRVVDKDGHTVASKQKAVEIKRRYKTKNGIRLKLENGVILEVTVKRV